MLAVRISKSLVDLLYDLLVESMSALPIPQNQSLQEHAYNNLSIEESFTSNLSEATRVISFERGV